MPVQKSSNRHLGLDIRHVLYPPVAKMDAATAAAQSNPYHPAGTLCD